MKCIHRMEDGSCAKYTTDTVHSWCIDWPCEDAIPSRADNIRSMSDEELAVFLSDFVSCDMCPVFLKRCDNDDSDCLERWLAWLKGADIQ